jgi:hypothetical protein
VSNPFGKGSGAVPRSHRDPSELVKEIAPPRSSHERPALKAPIPREEPVSVACSEEEDDDPARTPRPVDGGIALASVPRLVAPPERLKALPLDHKAGFVLACIDGESNVQTLIDVSGLPPVDVVRTLERLVELGIVLVR